MSYNHVREDVSYLAGLVRRVDNSHLGRDSLVEIERENYDARKFFNKLVSRVDGIRQDLRRRSERDGSSLPTLIGWWIYYDRWRANDDYVVHCRRSIAGGLEEVLLDENDLGRHRVYFDLSDWAVSPDDQYLAWTVDSTGSEAYRLFIKNLKTGDVEDVSPEFCDATFEWGATASEIFYAKLNDDGQVSQVCSHKPRKPWDQDEILYEETDEAFSVGISRSRCARWLLIETGGFNANETRLFPLDQNPRESSCGARGVPPRLIEPRRDGVEYFVDVVNDELIILANDILPGEPDFTCYRTGSQHLGRAHWRQVYPGAPGWIMEGAEIFSEFYVISDRSGAKTRLRAFDLNDRLMSVLQPKTELAAIDLSDNESINTRTLRIDHSHAVYPDRTVMWTVGDGLESVLWEEDPGDDYEAENYSSTRRFVNSHDGELIPVSLLFRKSTLRVGGNPCLLYVYGAYEDVSSLSFDADRVSLLDAGVIVATAHVRGGGERGRVWYENGRRLRKINSVIDFVCVAEGLVNMGIVAKDAIVAHADSAGGLVVAAAINENPECFAGALLEVPFVDMITSLADDDLPTTIADRDEFGDPNDDDTMRHLARVSPIDNINRARLPPIFTTAGIADERVPIREPLKWTHRIRERSNAEPLLQIDHESGHHGPVARTKEIDALAMQYAFILSCLTPEEIS